MPIVERNSGSREELRGGDGLRVRRYRPCGTEALVSEGGSRRRAFEESSAGLHAKVGRLLIEEVEYIDTADPTLNSYLDMQQAMLKQQGNALHIGPRLDAILDSAPMKRRASEVQVLGVPANQAAAMFLMNFGVWRHNGFVQRTYGAAALDDLESHLQAVTDGRIENTPVEWGLRQIVMERVA